MFAKAKEEGCKSKMSLFFLGLNIIIAFCLAVITAHMATNGCSRVNIAVTILSFFYIILNFLLIFWDKAWNRCFSFFSLFLIFCILLVTLVGLGFTVYQSVCEVNVCYNGLSSEIDNFYKDFRKGDEKQKFEDQYCDLIANKVVEQYIAFKIASYSHVEPKSDNYFYIVKGWPIAFEVLQFILTFFHLIQNFLNLYSCKGCKPQKKEQQEISYF